MTWAKALWRTLVAVGACASLAACSDRSSTPAPAVQRDPLSVTANADLLANIQVGKVTYAEVRQTLRVPARIEVDETRMARIGSPVTGRVTDLEATVGQNVRRGQVLAKINSTELSTAQLGYLKAFSQRALAQRSAFRAQQLLDADVIGSAELQRRQSELVQAEAEVSAARDQLKVLGMSDAAVQKLGESRTVNSIAQIVASVNGTVIERKVTEGQVVQPADGVFLVADLSSIWVVADIPEQSAGSIRIGEAIEAEVAALPGRRFAGSLSFVSPTVNPETRTIRARMDLHNTDGEFKPAMLATVLIKGKPQRQPVVPVAAVVRDENRDFVFVRTGEGTFQARPVSLGAEYEGKRVLVGGLQESDAIVVDGAFHLNNERKRRELEGV
jgi:cobalt-zinc-cadmium efflux system membrane fusion protein